MALEVFKNMLGLTMAEVSGGFEGSEEVIFKASNGSKFTFYHSQDCCENVTVAEVIGDPQDLLASPMVEAEEISSDGAPDPSREDSFTWTFYRFGTARGSVVIRWLGTSNGYYSESVTRSEELVKE